MSEVSVSEARERLDALVRAAGSGEPAYLTEHGRRVAALVSAERLAELEAFEAAEDAADAEAADVARVEGGEPVPWETVKAELGL